MTVRRYSTPSNVSGSIDHYDAQWHVSAYEHCEGGYRPIGSFDTEEAARERAREYFGNDREVSQ